MDITAQVDRCFLVLWLVLAIDFTASGVIVLAIRSADHGPILLGRLCIKRINYGLTRMKQRRKDTWLSRLALTLYSQKALALYFVVGGIWSVLFILSSLLKP